MVAEPDTVPLVRRAQAGDVAAFAYLAARYHASLTRFARRLMGDVSSGEDLVQETVLRAQQSIGRLGEPYRFGPWLFGIAANLAKKAWRAERRRPLSLESLVSAYPHVAWDESYASGPSPEQICEAAEETRLLIEAIKALPASLSRVVELHYLNGLAYAEVASALALPVSTVKGRLFESRARLRRALCSPAGAPAHQPAPSGSPLPPPTGALPHTALSARGVPIPAPTRPAHGHKSRHMKGDVTSMDNQEARPIRVEVHLNSVVSEAHRFVTMPWPRPQPTDTLQDLASRRNCFVPLVVLEQMVLDGVTRRQDVADLIAAAFDPQHFDVR